MLDEIKKDIGYWYMGTLIIVMAISIYSTYLFYPLETEKALPYKTIMNLFILVCICFGIMYLSAPLSKVMVKLLLKNERIRKWAEKKYAR